MKILILFLIVLIIMPIKFYPLSIQKIIKLLMFLFPSIQLKEYIFLKIIKLTPQFALHVCFLKQILIIDV